jgi:hypothetical protein
MTDDRRQKLRHIFLSLFVTKGLCYALFVEVKTEDVGRGKSYGKFTMVV